MYAIVYMNMKFVRQMPDVNTKKLFNFRMFLFPVRVKNPN